MIVDCFKIMWLQWKWLLDSCWSRLEFKLPGRFSDLGAAARDAAEAGDDWRAENHCDIEEPHSTPLP